MSFPGCRAPDRTATWWLRSMRAGCFRLPETSMFSRRTIYRYLTHPGADLRNGGS